MQVKFLGPVGEYSDKVAYATPEEVMDFCQKERLLGLDIETCRKYKLGVINEEIYQGGLDPYLSLICMLQIGNKDIVYVIDVRQLDKEYIKALFVNAKETTYCGQNLKFEAKFLKHHFDITLHKIYDIMLCEQVLTNGLGKSKDNPTGLSYSLEAMAGRYLGIQKKEERDLFTTDEDDADVAYIDKSTRLQFLSIGNRPFTETQILYGADDIIYPLLIREKQLEGREIFKPEWHIYRPLECFQLENDFCLVLADIELKGLYFDKEQWLRNYEDNLVIFKRRKEKLNRWVIEHKDLNKFCLSPDMFNLEKICRVEWTSSQQVVKLFTHLGFCPKEKSKTTYKLEYTVGAKALTKLLPAAYKEKYEMDEETEIQTNEDLILNYLLFKVAEQSCTTFGKDYLKYIHPITGRLHSTYKQILATSRVSSSNPNLQNLPADEGFRKAFTAPDGYKLIDCDYSGQESRVLADISGDTSLVDFFNNGHPIHKTDMHCWVATMMFSLMRKQPDLIVTKKTHPKERHIAKSLNFKIAYGGSAHTLKDDFGCTIEEAQAFIDAYMGAFPQLKKYFDTVESNVLKRGWIQIDQVIERRWFSPEFPQLKELQDQAWACYPKGYKEMPRGEKKDKIKEQVKEQHPELKQIWSKFFTLKGELSRCARNYPIQGVAGNQTKQAGVYFRKYQIENNLQDKVYLTNLIHDEAMAEAVNGFENEATELLLKCMEKGGGRFTKSVKMTAAGGETKWWGH